MGDPMETKTTKVAVSKKLFQAIHDALIANKLARPGEFKRALRERDRLRKEGTRRRRAT